MLEVELVEERVVAEEHRFKFVQVRDYIIEGVFSAVFTPTETSTAAVMYTAELIVIGAQGRSLQGEDRVETMPAAEWNATVNTEDQGEGREGETKLESK